MGFLTPALLAGLGLIALPVILHLVMRRQPQRLVFPALRFVQQRRDANRRRVKLRHWLLLAMRCLLVAALALALARPTLQGSGLRGKEGAPLAVAMVVDNSLRMEYVRQNQTRLEQATEIAAELIGKMPEETEVSVVDLGRASSGFVVDRGTALARLTALRPKADVRPLVEAILEAIELTADLEDHRQEVFVFTDLAATAWNDDAQAAIAEALEAAVEVQLYVVDVGVESSANASLGAIQLRRNVLRPGESLHLQSSVELGGIDAAPLVELSLDGEDGAPVKRDQRLAIVEPAPAAVDPGAQTPANAPNVGITGPMVAFDVADLPLGTHQGTLRLTAADPLAMDNTRYFTVEVRPPARVLLLAESPEAAIFVREALSPSQLNVPLRFICDVRTFDEVAATQLDDYQTVMLLDPPPLADDAWDTLLEFAEAGGGVGIMLGHNAELAGMNALAAQRLLPGPLKLQARDETYLRPRRLDHPSLAALRDYEESIPWSQCRVFTYWQFADRHDDAYVIAQYANGEPALVERQAGRGRLLTFTTPWSDPLEPAGREPWNVLTAPALAWPFVAICDELVGYLAQDADDTLNYLAGETVRVPLGSREEVSKYVLRQPNGEKQRRTTPPGEATLVLSTTDELGNYRLTAGGGLHRLDRGFSVNAAEELSDLTRIDPNALAESMPAGRFEIAESLAAAEEYVDVGRSGRELYPWAIMLVTLVWGAEHVLANRFYRE